MEIHIWTCPWCDAELTVEELAWDQCGHCGQPVLIDEGDDPDINDDEDETDGQKTRL